VLTLVNCHCKLGENPVGDVEPVQLVVQYLTKAAIKLPSAGENTRSSGCNLSCRIVSHRVVSCVLLHDIAGVSSLFTRTGCDRSAIDEMLSAQEGVTDQNLLQYLGIIEARANQLLLTRAFIIKHQVVSDNQSINHSINESIYQLEGWITQSDR